MCILETQNLNRSTGTRGQAQGFQTFTIEVIKRHLDGLSWDVFSNRVFSEFNDLVNAVRIELSFSSLTIPFFLDSQKRTQITITLIHNPVTTIQILLRSPVFNFKMLG